MTLVICGSDPSVVRRRIMPCPTCERRRRFAVLWGGAWYGETQTCLGCGDTWTSGEMHPQPFRRGWRQASITRARLQWGRALAPAEYERRVRADLDYALADLDA